MQFGLVLCAFRTKLICVRANVEMTTPLQLQTAPPYNTTLALFMIVAHHTRRGRHIFGVLIALILSIVVDLAFYADIDLKNLNDKANYIPLILVPFNVILKVVGIVSAYWIFVSLGGAWSLAENQGLQVEDRSAAGHGLRTPAASVADSSGMPDRTWSQGEPSIGHYRDAPAGFYSPAQVPGVRDFDGGSPAPGLGLVR